MKSKCCGLEGHGKGPSEEEMVQEVTGKNGKLKVQSEEDRKLKAELPELSRNQLLHLLGVMEGEVQVATSHQYLICQCHIPASFPTAINTIKITESSVTAAT